ncbi:four helix bundle protein [Tenuifilum thalassicum]|uniref:Four helix bundle protein n=1 Tax=Tenuifilum thalassicum TaxID=2590900 RepID=A0A7D4BEU8_9BACT|nr:four helix bundle protein [Tenuifilum thalassicum]QKG80238.1 four helix bundle protein [Tenuifilum thalassicum]
MKIEQFENLDIWQEARELCKTIRVITEKENFSKNFNLKNQILSSCGSIMDNIAEGFERGGNKEFIQFLYVAKGSCGETRSQLYRAYDFGYISDSETKEIIEKTVILSKKISSLINYLKSSGYRGSKYKAEK